MRKNGCLYVFFLHCTSEIRRPGSYRKEVADDALIGPTVSTAIGWLNKDLYNGGDRGQLMKTVILPGACKSCRSGKRFSRLSIC